MPAELFIDGVTNISFGRGVIRIDLCSLSVAEQDNSKKPVLEIRQRLLMTPDGFLELQGAVGRMFQKLLETGIIKQKDNTNPGMNESSIPKSPNFSE